MRFISKLVFFVVIVAVSAQKIKDPEKLAKFNKIFDECKTEIGIADDIATKLKSGDFSDRSEKAQCFSGCIFTKQGFFDKEDKLDRDAIIKILLEKEPDSSTERQVTEVVDKCLPKVGKDKCETAFNVYECYFTKRFGSKNHLDIVKACIEESKVNHEIAIKVKFGDFTERGKEVQCTTSCIFKKKNTFKDGKFDRDALIKEVVSEEGDEFKDDITKAIDKCLPVGAGADECETAYKLFECYWNVRHGLKKTMDYVKVCTKEHNITDDTAAKLRVGHFLDNSKNVQCFGACLFKKQGFFDKDGKLARNVIIGRLVQKEPETPKFDKIIESVDKCISLVGADDCETAFKFYECYWTHRFGLPPVDANPKIAEVIKAAIAA